MLPAIKLFFLAPALFIALMCLGIGTLVIAGKKPLLLRYGLVCWLLTISVSPFLVGTVYAILTEFPVALFSPMGLLLVALIYFLYRLWSWNQGYFVFGASQETLQSCMQASLMETGYPFEETVLGFHLPSVDNSLQVTFLSWLATAAFFMKSREKTGLIHRIAQNLRQHLRQSGADVESGAWIYAVAGLLVLIFAVIQVATY